MDYITKPLKIDESSKKVFMTTEQIQDNMSLFMKSKEATGTLYVTQDGYEVVPIFEYNGYWLDYGRFADILWHAIRELQFIFYNADLTGKDFYKAMTARCFELHQTIVKHLVPPIRGMGVKYNQSRSLALAEGLRILREFIDKPEEYLKALNESKSPDKYLSLGEKTAIDGITIPKIILIRFLIHAAQYYIHDIETTDRDEFRKVLLLEGAIICFFIASIIDDEDYESAVQYTIENTSKFCDEKYVRSIVENMVL